jgi:hypothetical protein
MSSKNFGVVWMDYRRVCAERPEKGYPHACEFEVAADRSRIVQHPPQPADCATPSSITCVSACATAPVERSRRSFHPPQRLDRFVRWRRAGIWSRIMETTCRCSRPRCPNDRYVHCSRSSAHRLHRSQQEAVHGPVARRTDLQDSCGGRYQRIAESKRRLGVAILRQQA